MIVPATTNWGKGRYRTGSGNDRVIRSTRMDIIDRLEDRVECSHTVAAAPGPVTMVRSEVNPPRARTFPAAGWCDQRLHSVVGRSQRSGAAPSSRGSEQRLLEAGPPAARALGASRAARTKLAALTVETERPLQTTRPRACATVRRQSKGWPRRQQKI